MSSKIDGCYAELLVSQKVPRRTINWVCSGVKSPQNRASSGHPQAPAGQ